MHTRNNERKARKRASNELIYAIESTNTSNGYIYFLYGIYVRIYTHMISTLSTDLLGYIAMSHVFIVANMNRMEREKFSDK